ncbi:contact-dependent growth inhibition system immunity protein [Gimesia sp.]|uniref:contact-dependent growth inhibition system immunity protein n=1 Tax=Gimesia sp. TaxID=2024833 RepID=UPI0025C262A5|nr:contact-dependent growth inhibition system immunity protein [Gimesia sp.]
MKTNFDRRRTLQELEQEDWGEPDFDSSLVKTCHRLRRVPLNDFSTEDLRIMIGQQISLFFLIPLALETLEEDPLVEGHCYPGDLLNAVLGVPESFWNIHTDKREVLRRVITKANETLDSLKEHETRTVRKLLANAPDSLTDS